MAITINGSTGISGVNGSAATPAIQGGDSDTGIFFGTDTASVATAGNERLIVDANGNINIDSGGVYYDATNNRLGIGTTSPTAKLMVGENPNGTTLTSGGGAMSLARNGDTFLEFWTSGGTQSSKILFNQAGTEVGNIEYVSSNLKFNVNGSERLCIDSSGRLLVGTSSARNNLFNGSVTAINQVEVTADSTVEYLGVRNTNNTNGSDIVLAKSRGTTAGSNTIVQSGDALGTVAFMGSDGTEFVLGGRIACEVDGTPGSNDMPGRLVFSTTADGASSPTERMRISQNGYVYIGEGFNNVNHRINGVNDLQGDLFLVISAYQSSGGSSSDTAEFFGCAAFSASSAATAIRVGKNTGTNRSINAGGTINASGSDYAEYMTKAGSFTIAKGDICGVNAEGRLTNVFTDSVAFVVKSTDPSYVGGDNWHFGIGDKPGGSGDNRTEEEIAKALVIYEEALETVRQTVDRIAFAGQVPVNVLGATPGQYIIPAGATDGSIEGIAKNEADLTLAEYMRAVGKVIAIEDDGRARIIVKVA